MVPKLANTKAQTFCKTLLTAAPLKAKLSNGVLPTISLLRNNSAGRVCPSHRLRCRKVQRRRRSSLRVRGKTPDIYQLPLERRLGKSTYAKQLQPSVLLRLTLLYPLLRSRLATAALGADVLNTAGRRSTEFTQERQTNDQRRRFSSFFAGL